MVINYQCNLCDNSIEKLILDPKDVIGVMACQCGGFLERQLSAPSSSSSELVQCGKSVQRIFYNSDRRDMAREQGDKLIKEQKEKEKLNEEKS